MDAHGILVVRRLSGGGRCHDTGNLNFTIVDQDTALASTSILSALWWRPLARFGVHADSPAATT